MRLIPVLLALLTLAGVAVAADPPNGKVDRNSPQVKWTGSLTQPYAGGYVPFFATEGSADTPCQSPSCDRFELEVADGPANLDIQLTMTSIEGGFDTIRIIKPDGSVHYQYDQEDGPLKARLKNAANGKYMVDVTSGSKTVADYEAIATLAVPGAPPAPAPTPSPVPVDPPPPASAPSPVGVTATAPKVSARKANRSRKIVVTVNTTRDAAVRAELKRGKRTVAAGGGRVNGSGKVTMKVTRKLKKGVHTLVVTASDGQSQGTSTRRVKVKR